MTLRVVFDTNTVVSALLFSKGRLAWLRRAWERGEVVPLVSKNTVRELLRVLAYPKFQLSKADREDLLAEYLPFAEAVEMSTDPRELPRCRGPHDQKFLELAVAGNSDAVVTGESDLLEMADAFPMPILTAAELRDRLATGAGSGA
ncbi:MAG: putative toxin-antitoxin system toxin component, PIN family [Deferrisomatales bacterium]